MNPRSKSERPLKTRLREAARGEILAAAERVVSAHGAQKARMEEVALAAGVSVGTLYNHFSDKEALINALLEERRAQLIERIDGSFVNQAPFPAQLEAFIRATLEHFSAHRQLFNVLLQEEGEHGGSSRMRGSPALKIMVSRAKAIVDRGLELKALRPDDAQLYPAFLMATVKGALAQIVREDPEDLDPVKMSSTLARMFLQGAGKR